MRQLAIIISGIFFISGLIFKKNKIIASFKAIDALVMVNMLYLTTVFFRNPVGFAVLGGGERVGGKPYVDVALAFAAYLMLSRFKISPSLSKALPYWILASSFFTATVGAIGMLLPDVGILLAPYYSGFDPTAVGAIMSNDQENSGETRLGFFQNLGRDLVLIVVSKTNPSRLIGLNRLGQLIIYIAGLIMILLSGFRNAILNSMLMTAISLIIREKFVGILKVCILAIFVASSGILLSYSSVHLPFSFQRALSFLPGKWDSEAVNDANNSAEWRYEMWEIVLTTDKYIHNKIFGDGFGFMRSDYEKMMDIRSGISEGFGGENDQQEAYMLNGDYHSGPVGSIRFVGVVGLILFLPLIITTSWYAFRIIKRSLGTPFEFCAFFIGIPTILLPVFFVFVIGDYRQDLVNVLFDIGMIKLLTNSLEDFKNKQDALPFVHLVPVGGLPQQNQFINRIKSRANQIQK